ncbi:MAG: hypothetical protein IT317_10630 [Anaerolineales bacterium]|nr:hypothetical protein [Anaerolineales bacterium]
MWLGWLVGAAALAIAAMQGIAKANLLELAVLIWLAPLALYDLRRKEVPHMACVAVPCLAAIVYSLAGGIWQLSAAAAIAVVASERSFVRDVRVRRWLFSVALAVACLLVLDSGEAAPGAIGVIGFWLAFELGWWAGADAVVAITLALLWPGVELLVAIAAAHLGIMVILWLARKLRVVCERIQGGQSSMHLQSNAGPGTTLPGLPIITLAVVLLFLARLNAQSLL